MNMAEELKLLAGQIKERAETLCAIHGDDNIKLAIGVVLTLDSLVDVVAAVMRDCLEDDDERGDAIFDLLKDSCVSIHSTIVEMCDVKDHVRLSEDIISIAQLRRTLARRLN